MSCSVTPVTAIRGVLALLRDERGATAMEYAFIASLISLSILVASLLIGPRLNTIYSNVAANLT